MANSCEFNLKATGRKEDIERLYNMLNYDESEKYKDDEEGLNDLYYTRSEEIINKLY